MGQIDGPSSCKPRVFHRSLLTASKERREGEDTNGNTGQSSAPPSSVPWEHGLANNFTNKSCWNHELRQVFAPSEIPVGEQHVPVWEHESSLSVGVSRTVKWWRNQPCIEQENGEHRSENDAVTQHFVRPKTVTCTRSLALLFCLLEVFFLLHVHGGNSAKIVNQSHFFSPFINAAQQCLEPKR